jgi:tetratricopeptide (TPR) repeat protein
VLHLSGDGCEGIPLFDGTLSPVKAGLQVEVLPDAKLTLKEHVAQDLKELKESRAFELLHEPRVKDLALADGTQAMAYDAEFVRLQNDRVSFYSKVYANDARGRRVVATGFVTCGRPGRQSIQAIALPDLVRAHTTSLVLDAEKFDATWTRAAYEKYNWKAGIAITLVGKGNDLLEKKQYARASTAFQESLKSWEHLPAAHNGIAWSLLHADGSQAEEVNEALREARKAVEQTEELDFAALDTLALAYHRSGDREQAIRTIKQALKLRPNDPELRARLKSFD